jgi:hypothetical protein
MGSKIKQWPRVEEAYLCEYNRECCTTQIWKQMLESIKCRRRYHFVMLHHNGLRTCMLRWHVLQTSVLPYWKMDLWTSFILRSTATSIFSLFLAACVYRELKVKFFSKILYSLNEIISSFFGLLLGLSFSFYESYYRIYLCYGIIMFQTIFYMLWC